MLESNGSALPEEVIVYRGHHIFPAQYLEQSGATLVNVRVWVVYEHSVCAAEPHVDGRTAGTLEAARSAVDHCPTLITPPRARQEVGA